MHRVRAVIWMILYAFPIEEKIASFATFKTSCDTTSFLQFVFAFGFTVSIANGHLPSPAVFLVLLIAKAISPKRKITVHWHCFLEKRNDFIGFLYGFYQDFSLALIPFFSGIITTSPALRDSLIESGCSKAKIIAVPCSLSEDQESSLLAIDRLNNKNFPLPRPLSVLFIGRLDSYKRLDWLLLSLSYLQDSMDTPCCWRWA